MADQCMDSTFNLSKHMYLSPLSLSHLYQLQTSLLYYKHIKHISTTEYVVYIQPVNHGTERQNSTQKICTTIHSVHLKHTHACSSLGGPISRDSGWRKVGAANSRECSEEVYGEGGGNMEGV